jgi:site-specific DNA-cytosine methylase
LTEDARQHLFLHIYSDMTEHKHKVFVENVSGKLTKRGKQLSVPIRIKMATMFLWFVLGQTTLVFINLYIWSIDLIV